MKIIDNKELVTFLRDFPLYSKTLFLDTFDKNYEFNVLDFFESKAYKFYCPFEKEEHTFKFGRNYGQQYVLDGNNIVDYFKDNFGKLNFTFALPSNCQSCDYKMEFLFNIFTDEAIENGKDLPKIYIRKFGQFPTFERNPEKIVLDYLNEEDKENYRKALSNLSVSYGIGAFAYFRRIIENEIKRLVKDISELDFDGSDKVKLAWSEYEMNHQMSNLITNINPYIPKSLKEIGDNPIKLLHDQLSGGIHEFSEEVCLVKARQIDVLLRYVIKKVNSEKYDLIEVRKAMLDLRK